MNNGKKDLLTFMMKLRDGNYTINWNIKASDSLKDLIKECL